MDYTNSGGRAAATPFAIREMELAKELLHWLRHLPHFQVRFASQGDWIYEN